MKKLNNMSNFLNVQKKIYCGGIALIALIGTSSASLSMDYWSETIGKTIPFVKKTHTDENLVESLKNGTIPSEVEKTILEKKKAKYPKSLNELANIYYKDDPEKAWSLLDKAKSKGYFQGTENLEKGFLYPNNYHLYVIRAGELYSEGQFCGNLTQGELANIIDPCKVYLNGNLYSVSEEKETTEKGTKNRIKFSTNEVGIDLFGWWTPENGDEHDKLAMINFKNKPYFVHIGGSNNIHASFLAEDRWAGHKRGSDTDAFTLIENPAKKICLQTFKDKLYLGIQKNDAVSICTISEEANYFGPRIPVWNEPKNFSSISLSAFKGELYFFGIEKENVYYKSSQDGEHWLDKGNFSVPGLNGGRICIRSLFVSGSNGLK